MDLYEEIKALVSKKNYEKADLKLTELLKDITPQYTGKKGKQFCFNHILEVYYYEYFINRSEAPSYLDVNLNAFYRLQGFIKMQCQDTTAAITAYKEALAWNPVDLDSLLQLGELYKTSQMPDECLEITNQAYHFCCTRATLARFYRNLGFYYLEKYKPEVATALYLYSNYFNSSKQAQSELDFLEKALKRETPKLSLKEIQSILKSHSIPLGPDPDALGITYRVGQLEEAKGNFQNAFDCYSMVYDVTMDKEVMEDIKRIQNNHMK